MIDKRQSVFASSDDIVAGLIEFRLSRLSVLEGLGIAIAMTTLGDATLGARTARTESGLGFTELAKTNDQTHHVAPSYEAQVLIRWGDPIMAGALSFDPKAVGAASQ